MYGSALPPEEYAHSHCAESPPQEFPLAQVSEVSENNEGARFIAMEVNKLVKSQHFLEHSAKFREDFIRIGAKFDENY